MLFSLNYKICSGRHKRFAFLKEQKNTLHTSIDITIMYGGRQKNIWYVKNVFRQTSFQK